MKPVIITVIAFIISGVAIIGVIVAIQEIVVNQAQQALDEYQQEVSSLETIEQEKLQITKEPSQSSNESQKCSGIARCIEGTVTQIVDGDTIKVDGQSIRFALASAPEWDEYGGDTATELITELCPVGSTAIVDEDDGQTQGSYGRILGVIYCNGVNLNEELLDSGLGYLSSGFCDKSEFSTQSWAQKHGCSSSIEPEVSAPAAIQDCDPSYPDFCIPTSPPDLDCGDISQKRFTVLPPDPHRFDGDKDGIGCES